MATLEEGASVSKVLVECQAPDGTTVFGTPLSFYPWSTTVQMQLSQTTLGSAGGFTCSFPPYQTAQIDVQATLTNSETSPSQIQANIYSLVRDKVHNICVHMCAHTVHTVHYSMYVHCINNFCIFHCMHTSHTDVSCDFCMLCTYTYVHTCVMHIADVCVN